MELLLNAEGTLGELLFLGYSDKMRYDKATGKKTDELESHACRIASSKLQGQIEVMVPCTIPVEDIKFSQKIVLEDVRVDPYARTTADSTFAEVVLRCRAANILDASRAVPPVSPAAGEKKPEENKPGEKKHL